MAPQSGRGATFVWLPCYGAEDTGEVYEYNADSHEWLGDGRLAGFIDLDGVCDGVLHFCNDDHLDLVSGMRKPEMQKFPLLAALLVAGLPVIASAHGCIKGAAVGGVVGHVAGHHGVAGAAIGCAVGHHRAKEKEKAAQAASQGTPPAPSR
jgi:hypothetical protein